MGPIAKQAASSYADKGVAFVTFDFTSDETTAAAKAAADQYKVSKIYMENEKRTGFCLIVDPASGEVVTKLSAKNDIGEWNAAIDKALGDG